VVLGVFSAGVRPMLGSLGSMTLCGLGVVGTGFMPAFVVMLCRFAMMPGGVVMVFGCPVVMFG
jgi:hypothetical protein